MAVAHTMWNKDHDIAILMWSRRPSDFPLDPINNILELFYQSEPSIFPFLYAVWDGNTELGILVSGSMELGDDPGSILTAMFNEVVESERIAPLRGDYAMQEWNV